MAITFRGSASSQVMLGNDAVEQNLMLVENGVRSRVNILVKRAVVLNDQYNVLTTVMNQIKLSRIATSANTRGVLLGKVKWDSSQTSDTNVKIFSDNPHASIAADEDVTSWQTYTERLHTGFGQCVSVDLPLEPVRFDDSPPEIILVPGKSLLIQAVSSVATANAAILNNWVAQILWEEDSLATFNISGTVTLNASPIVGAKVMVIEADDEALTNAFLVEVKTTAAGGVWSSSIRSGKVGAAFVQYVTGGVYYTAPGSPFLES